MGLDHEFYEVQSVLAAAGQLTAAELIELERHADACSSCRECLTDMAEMSRELFMAQAGTMPTTTAPARMQDRFLARASQSGIPVRRSAPAMAGVPLVAGVAFAAVLAVVMLSGWRHPSALVTERDAPFAYVVEENKPIPASEANASSAKAPQGEDELLHKVRLRQRAGVQRRAASIADANRNDEISLNLSATHNLWPDGIRPGQLTAITYMSAPSFAKDSNITAFFGHRDNSKSEERTFHLDPKLASLSFLEFPQDHDVDLDTVRPTFTTPAFHLNTNRIW